MIESTELTLQSEEGKVFENVDVEIGRGESVLLTGPCDADKTSLALSFIGAIPTLKRVKNLEGTVRIDGKEISEFSKQELSRKVDAVLPEPETQILGLTVEGDVAFGCENLGLPGKEIQERVDDALELMELEEYRNRDPRHLSGGEKQRVVIASALAKDPEILVLCDPSFHLDPKGKEVVRQVLEELKSRGKTLILVETKLDSSTLVADRALVLEDAEISHDIPLERFLENRDLLENLGLLPPRRGEIRAR